jgi:hypothetical protein
MLEKAGAFGLPFRKLHMLSCSEKRLNYTEGWTPILSVNQFIV